MTELVSAEKIARGADPLPRGAPSPQGPAAKAPEAKTNKAPAKKRGRGRAILALVLLGGAGAGAWYGHRYWTEGRFLVSTDDAYVKADMATISAKVSGYVEAVGVVENQAVRKGDVLARIDPLDYRLAVEAAQGKIATQTVVIGRIAAQAGVQRAASEQARAALASAQADRARAEAEFARAQSLVQHNVGTEQRLDQARADRDRTAAAVLNAQAQVKGAEANLPVLDAQREEAARMRDELQVALARAARDLDFATLRAPFDGIVGNKAVQPGMLVQPGARLLTLVPPQTAYVEANFKETQLAFLRPGQVAHVRLDARADRAVDGVVESFAPASGSQFSLLPPENATGNFTKIVQRVPVRIRLPADVTRDSPVQAGLSVVVDVDTRTGASR